MRVDTYIWYLRYYKSRSQAIKACRQGHIRIGDQIIKPSREVFVGDKIGVRKNQVINLFPKHQKGTREVVGQQKRKEGILTSITKIKIKTNCSNY